MLASFIFPRTREGTSVYISSFRACLLILVMMSPWTGFAAGLGKLTINSSLGQPLQAEIDLVAVKNEEISSLAAQLASHEAFRQAGIDYKSFFSSFKISIEPRSNGDPFIKIMSPTAINEPFLNMLVELNWASGRLMREYTVLLDPLESATSNPVAPILSHNLDASSIQSKEAVTSVSQVEQATAPEVKKPAPVSDKKNREKTYGPVNQGDTLSSIAGEVSPQGVSLNQVLIAMFRANRDAFIEDNMNLLKVGVVLRIPDRNEILAIPESEANKEVKVQVADWRSYRNRLVAAMNESPVNESPKQSDKGQITTTSADESIAINEPPKEVLRLSSGAQLDGMSSDGGNGNVMAQDRLQMMEEDAIARNFALNEANERIAMLEKNIKDLQLLLELKDPSLAEAQMQAESLLSAEPTAPELAYAQEQEFAKEADSEAVPSDPNDLHSDKYMDPSISQNSTVQSEASEPLAVSDELLSNNEVSLIDQLMKNIEYVGGAVTFLLLGTLAVVIMRRRKSEEVLEADDTEFDASVALRERMASVKAFDSLASHEINAAHQDPDNATTHDALVDERFEEEISKADLDTFADESVNDSTTNTKIDSEDDSLFESENSSGQLVESDNAIDIELGDAVDNNQQVEHSELSDDNEFNLDLDDSSSAADNTMSDQEEHELDLNLDDETLLEEPMKSESSAHDLDDMFNQNLTEEATNDISTEENIEQAEVETVPFETDNSIRFDLDTPAEEKTNAQVFPDESAIDDQNEALKLAEDLPDDADRIEQDEANRSEEIVNDSELMANQNETMEPDLAQKSDTDGITPIFDSNLLSSDSSLSDLKSEMNLPAPMAEEEEIAESADTPTSSEKDEHWHEVETKIDLAKAYLDMEDKEGAREILEEIINEGDEQQKESAKSLLAEL